MVWIDLILPASVEEILAHSPKACIFLWEKKETKKHQTSFIAFSWNISASIV